MAKEFNITGTCFPNKHYMVDISDRVAVAKRMVDKGQYFCINRGRQYGKTTLLRALCKELGKQYEVFLTSFEGMGDSAYETEERLGYEFLRTLELAASGKISVVSEQVVNEISLALNTFKDRWGLPLSELARVMIRICQKATKPIVLLIDEVDQASNFKPFLSLLGLLRMMYLNREDQDTFQSVILAGVYDIKNLKLKIRPEAEHQYNSPWNIATDFNVDMSFNVKDVAGMLTEYENDHHTGMDIHAVAQDIVDYTSGYPFLVSKLCKMIDETPFGWDHNGLVEAVKQLLIERNTLFDDMAKKLDDFPELRQALNEILFYGEKLTFINGNKAFELGRMFNFICIDDKKVRVSNRIFETYLYNLFAYKDERRSKLVQEASYYRNQFIENGQLNVEKILQRFIVHYQDIYGDRDDKFHEREGRKYFMFYVKPIINGVGNYYIEPETRDQTRLDMVIDYLGKQYVIEMKIWRGNAYNERGKEQLLGYLDHFHLDKGYLVSFCFNKNKKTGVQTVQMDDGREIVEAIV